MKEKLIARHFALRYAVIMAIALAGCNLSSDSGERAQEPLFYGTKPEAVPEPMTRPHAIILMIADGGGFNQLRAADYWRNGKSPASPYTGFDIALAVSTWPAGGSYDSAKAWSAFGYPPTNPTDSAAAATALATGHKTANGMIATDETGAPFETLIERAESKGMMTGIVTSVPISHATPAAFAAHDASRNDYTGIAGQMIHSSGLDVLMGCGDPEYDNDGNAIATDPRYTWVSQADWNALKAGTAANDANGDGATERWTLVRERTEFESLSTLPSSAGYTHVAGIPHAYETLQERRSGDGMAAAYAVSLDANVPTLGTMALGTLNLLSKSPTGFVLVIEGGAIDWANHAHQSGRMIEEADDFARTADSVLDWIADDAGRANTLLVVTADHESGYLLGEGSGAEAGFLAIENAGKGRMPNMAWFSTGHTNSLVPFYAKGTNARHFANDISGFDSRRGWYIDNASIGRRLLAMLE